MLLDSNGIRNHVSTISSNIPLGFSGKSILILCSYLLLGTAGMKAYPQNSNVDQNSLARNGHKIEDIINITFSVFANGRQIEEPEFNDDFPDQLYGSINAGQAMRRISLRKNRDIVSSDYKEIHYENGKRIVNTASSDPKEFCHYEGSIDNDPESYVTLNLCNSRMSGTVYADGKRYVIDHSRLLPYSQYESSSSFICGVPSAHAPSHNHVRRKRAFGGSPSYYKKYVTWKELYVEMAIVFDNSMYKKYGQDKKRLVDRAKELVTLINAYYQPLHIKVALVGVEIWSESDRVVVNTSGDATLDQFLRYRKVNLIHDIPNDHAQLLTNATFAGGVVGKAMKGTMCSTELSGAVVMDHDRFKSPVPIAATMAHEMGHNFGMEHDNDTCECPEQRCLMAASSSGTGNAYWSSCSMEYLSWSLSHGSDYCLRNKPPASKEPSCGNGFVEDGEECDCGLPSICDNACCDAKTCRFASGAACANGGCCDKSSCQYMPLATVCRDIENECDLPEYCNGKSETCPRDTYKQNGILCQDGKAFCYNGTCSSHDDQCKLVWGSTGQMAGRECYSLNRNGNAHGHCGIDQNDGTFAHCENEDASCGLLQCNHKTERTSYGDRSIVRMTSTVLHLNGQFINCHTAMVDLGLSLPNPGLVPNGAKCGNGKMCREQKCVPAADVLLENPCPLNCHESGVCNNLGHCHCISGYGGVDCSIPGLGGSIDGGPASTGAARFNVGMGVLIFVLVVLPLITAVVTILYRKRIIQAPRFKIIDLLFKRRPKSRPTSTTFSVDANQPRPRPFDSNSVSKEAPPIYAFPTDPPQLRSQQHASREIVGIYPVAGSTNNAVQMDSMVASHLSIHNGDHTIPSTTIRRHDPIVEEPSPPRRPARPRVEVLEQLYYTDAVSSPPVDYAGIKKDPVPDPKESLLSEVMTALEPEDGPVIIPQRRAPPPPPIDEEGADNNVELPNGNESRTDSVKSKKRFFESAGNHDSTLRRLSSTTGTKAKATDRKAAPEISDPLNPKIGGEPVAQAPSLQIVPHLDNHTLPRKKNSDAALSTSAAYHVRQANQRKSSAIDESEWRKGTPTSILVQRSQSSVTGHRPSIAPPPPPPPPIATKPFKKPSIRTPSSGEHSLGIPLVSKDNFDSDASSNGDENVKKSASLNENYYDVIASPVDEEKEEIYADIDEFRQMKNSAKISDLGKDAILKQSSSESRFISQPSSVNGNNSVRYGNLETKRN